MTPRDVNDPFAIPELTRGLRSFATPGALGGALSAAHDRFFGPLLDARRSANVAMRWPQRLSAFDAERLGATTRATLQDFAATHFPVSAPDRRSLAARLEDACGDLFDALASLESAAAVVRDATDDTIRAAAWLPWIGALQAVFMAADRGWEHSRALMAAEP